MSGDLVLNDSYEILTPSGWQNFVGMKRSFKRTIKVRFTDDSHFICTPDHILICNKKQIIASSIKPGQIIYRKIVVDIKLHKVLDVYDPIEVANGNLYLSDNIVSHNCKFLGSSLTLISANSISQMSAGDIIYKKDGLDVYEKPVRTDAMEGTTERVYCLVADTAKGVGGDHSAFVVIDMTELPYRIVAKYRDNKISPMLYPSVIHKVATEYNKAYVLVEINSSEQVADILYNEYEYDNMIMVNRSGDGQVISGGFGGGRTQFGVVTDKRVKRIGCSNFKTLIEEKRLLIPDADIISEISTFIQVKNSYAADEGYHDDLVMPLVLFSWATTNTYFKEMSNINIRHLIYENQMKMIEQDLTPFGFFDDGQSLGDGLVPNF
jgi:hypothetical protein